MRRGLVNLLPALTKFYGIKPADIDNMTLREILRYTQFMSEALS